MKILYIQKMPCIRQWKMANVFKDLGHDIYLGYMQDTLEYYYTLPLDCYKEVFQLDSIAAFAQIAPYFDVIHVHNEPDYWTSIALAMTKGTDIKIIHDCHDWVPGRQPINEDYMANSLVANCLADLVLYVSDIQRDFVRDKVDKFQAPNIVIPNYPLKKCIPSNTKRKLRKDGDRIKLVYAGGVAEDPRNHRYFIPHFKELIQAGYEIYVYAPRITEGYKKLEGFKGQYFNMGHCNYARLITELSQYDIGLLPFQKNVYNQVHLDMGLPNKLFEYISAGIPVACLSGLAQQEQFINDNKVGFIYDNIEEFKEKAPKVLDLKLDRFKWNMDDDIKKRLLPRYKKLSKGNKYTKISESNKLRYKGMLLSQEIYEDEQKRQVGFFGKGHDKDVVFEGHLLKKIMEEENEKEAV